MEITCPFCGHIGDKREFDLSMADEAFCPKCDRDFVIEYEDPEEDEEIE